ncbi:MAG TPA: hypothetical protein VFQ27_07825 [Xanthobacteraceae bacterium]|nr:hypothetical protein [Xanthobacteraceae bacterium]
MKSRHKPRARPLPPFSAPADPALLANANINPETGLSTDYLNHFGEAIMLLDMASQMPEARAELRRWRPLSYREYFAASQLASRERALAAYDLADAAMRRRFDRLCERLQVAILSARSALERQPAFTAGTARTVRRLRRLLAEADAMVHGSKARSAAPRPSRLASSCTAGPR